MRRSMILVTLTASVLALAACGGGSSSKGDAGGGSDGSTTSTTEAASGGGQFSTLAGKAKDAQVKVTYRNGGSADDFTIAQYGGDSFFGTGGDGFYDVGGKAYTCQTGDGEAQCFAIPGTENPVQGIVQGFFGAYGSVFDTARDARSVFGSVRTTTGNETIAGRKADCATVSASTFGKSGTVTVCLDHETGFLLRAGTTGDGGSDLIEATSFADATADDVKLPAEPESFPGQ